MPDLSRCKQCNNYTTSLICFDCSKKEPATTPTPKQQKPATKHHDAFYDSKTWQLLSEGQKKRFPFCQHLEPDGTMCLSLDRLAADHIIPRKRGGKDAYSNLQTLCQFHHSRKTLLEGSHSDYWGKPTITVVCGSPGSGKTTYVKKHMAHDDIVIDLDYIARAIKWDNHQGLSKAVLKLTLDMRDAAITHLSTCRGIKAAWVIEGGATSIRRSKLRDMLKAKVIVLMPSPSVCKQRIRADKTRDKNIDWPSLVDDWHRKYDAHSEDIIIRNA
jgi:5-methylcytosine-specific restriction endonuclease McrA/predicted kinase